MTENDLLSPYVRVALDYTIPPYWPFRERVIFDYELLLVKAGEIMITQSGVSYHCLPGDLFLIKPGQTHMMVPLGDVPFRHPHVHFDPVEDEDSPRVKVNFCPMEDISQQERGLFRRDSLSLPPFQLPDHIRLHSPLEAERLLFEIIREMELQQPLYRERCKGLMITLLVHLARELRSRDAHQLPEDQQALERVLLLMRSSLHEPLSLQRLAQEAGYSKSHLSALFVRTYGVSPVKYHQQLRLEKARQLVINSSLPVSAIGDLCGYRSLYAFSNAFKQFFGLCPLVCRSREQRTPAPPPGGE